MNGKSNLIKTMNNSTIRVCTLASCGGLLTLTAWNHHKPQAPEVDSSSTADKGHAQVKPKAKVATVASGSATKPELRLPLSLGQSGESTALNITSPTAEQVTARLKQLRQEREVLMRSRSVTIPSPPTRIEALTVARLPESLGRIDRSVVRPAVVPSVGPLYGGAAATPSVPSRSSAPVASIPTPASPPKLSSIQPVAAVSTPTVSSTGAAQVAPIQTPTSVVEASLQHQSYGLRQGGLPSLTPPTKLPNGPDGFHARELNSQAAVPDSRLLSQVRGPGETMITLTGLEVSTPAPGMKTQPFLVPANGSRPELSEQTPGFSPTGSSTPGIPNGTRVNGDATRS